MIFGAASAGVRAMSAPVGRASGLMQEGFSYLAGAGAALRVADSPEAAPASETSRPNRATTTRSVKGGGHGNYRTLVLAPASVSGDGRPHDPGFRSADEYRNPVGGAGDGNHRAGDGAGGVPPRAPSWPPPRSGLSWALRRPRANMGDLSF